MPFFSLKRVEEMYKKVSFSTWTMSHLDELLFTKDFDEFLDSLCYPADKKAVGI